MSEWFRGGPQQTLGRLKNKCASKCCIWKTSLRQWLICDVWQLLYLSLQCLQKLCWFFVFQKSNARSNAATPLPVTWRTTPGLLSLKLTWPLKMDSWKMNFLLGRAILRRENVSFREGTWLHELLTKPSESRGEEPEPKATQSLEFAPK